MLERELRGEASEERGWGVGRKSGERPEKKEASRQIGYLWERG